MKLVAVTADDFGASAEVNEAVRRAYRDGVLTCASLMAGAPAARAAMAMARAEGIPVGVHLTLVDGSPVLSPRVVPDLVDREGRFRAGRVWPAAHLFLSPRVRRQAAAECEAQVRAVLDAGLAVDHLNGHHHFHIHPSVLGIVIDLARRYGVPAVRVPIQPGWWPLARAPMAAMMAPWAVWARQRLRRAGIATNDALFGLHESGALTEAAWLGIIPRVGPGLTEIYCHPRTAGRGVSGGGGRGRHADELAALLSARVRHALDRAGVRRVAFTAVARGAPAARGSA